MPFLLLSKTLYPLKERGGNGCGFLALGFRKEGLMAPLLPMQHLLMAPEAAVSGSCVADVAPYLPISQNNAGRAGDEGRSGDCWLEVELESEAREHPETACISCKDARLWLGARHLVDWLPCTDPSCLLLKEATSSLRQLSVLISS